MTAGPLAKSPSVTTAPKVLSFLRGNPHFLLSVVLLACTWMAIAAIGWIEKLPVRWPEGVEVNEDWRMVAGLATKFGPFEREEKDGERIIQENIFADLGLGTSLDKQRRPNRCSNWYVSRIYRDTRIKDPRANPYTYWRLDVYYYTGLRDTVPHVPEICLQAGGVRVISSSTVALKVSALDYPWYAPAFRRTLYENYNDKALAWIKGVEYYIFSVNGVPFSDRNKVRWKLSSPLVTYCYFAKIQFSPIGGGGVKDPAEADRRAAYPGDASDRG